MRSKLLILVLLVAVVTSAALAQGDAPPPPDLGSGVVVIDGLNSPLGIFVDEEDTVWLTDGGTGGDQEITAIDVNSQQEVTANWGETGAVLRWTGEGEPEVVANVSSLVTPSDIISGGHLTVVDGTVYLTIGVWNPPQGEEVTIPGFSTVARVVDGAVEPIADLWAYEAENNPDQTINLDAHPYGIEIGPNGEIYVADAAANALYSVNAETGEVTTVAVFDPMPGVFPNPLRDNELLTDPVPTSVVVSEDGTIYVGLLSGAPFIPGSAKVVAVSSEGEVTDFATGLTMVTDISMGPDGNLYATQYGFFTPQGPEFNSGGVVRILEDGTSEVVVGGLPFVTGVDFDSEGGAYVLINGVNIPGAGAVVYYEGLTEMEGMPMPMPEMTPEATAPAG